MTIKSFQDVEFEKRVPRAVFQGNPRWVDVNEKVDYNFLDSTRRLRSEGYLRHPTPNEVFSLLMEDEANLGEYSAVRRDIYIPRKVVSMGLGNGIKHPFDYDKETPSKRNASGEWLHLFIVRDGDTIKFGEPPDNLDEGSIDPTKTLPYELDISNAHNFRAVKYFFVLDFEQPPSGIFIPLVEIERLNREIVPLLWSREFSDIPNDIRRKCGLVVPPYGWCRFASFGVQEDAIFYRPSDSEDLTFVINAYSVETAASRGVRKKFS